MKIAGYEGICRQCFEPIKTGEGERLHEGGLLCHGKCIKEHPGGYYVKLEKRKARKRVKK